MSWTETAAGMVGERTPVDLGVVAAWTGVSVAWAATVGEAIQPVTVLLALPIVFVFPGYVVVAGLFPESFREGTGGSTGLPPLERAVLSVFASLFLVPLAALATNFTPWGIGSVTMLSSVSLVTLAGTAAAHVRRVRVHPDRRLGWTVGDVQAAVERNGPGLGNPVEMVSRAVTGNSTAATVLNVVLVFAVVAAVGSVAQAVVFYDGPGHTETYLLTENESGSLVAADYPENLTEGQATPLVLGVENHRTRPVDYTILVRLQRVNSSGNATEVVETQSVAKFDQRLAPGERALVDHTVTPHLTGEGFRLVYMVYAGEPPSEPSVANADNEVHLWVTVGGRESGANVLECAKGCP